MASRGKRPAIRADRNAWIQLGKLLQRRRAHLGGGSQTRFARDHGVSVRRIRDIENASREDPSSWQIPTLEEVAMFYEVTFESMLAVLRGDADELTPAEPARAPVRLPAGGAELRLVDDERKAQAYPHFAAIMDRLFRLADARNCLPKDITGTELFGPATPDAATWDDERLRRLFSPAERAEMIADLRVREAGQTNGRGIA